LLGGKIDEFETPKTAAQRELLEETGVKAQKTMFLYKENIPWNNMLIEKHYFKCEGSEKITLNKESETHVWIHSGDMKKYSFAFRDDEAVEKYLAEFRD